MSIESPFLTPVNLQTGLAPLHFSAGWRQAKWISGVARPGSKAIARKNHEAHSISWAGRAQRQNHILGLNPRRGDPMDRPRARLFLRKYERISGWNCFPTDAFSAQCPCFLATRSTLGRKWRGARQTGKPGRHQNSWQRGGAWV